MKFTFNDNHVTGFDALFLLIANTLLIFPNICIDIFMSVISGALVGWLFGLLSLGTWIADGLNLMHVSVSSEDLYRVGSALGFIRCFFRISRSNGHNNACRNNADHT